MQGSMVVVYAFVLPIMLEDLQKYAKLSPEGQREDLQKCSRLSHEGQKIIYRGAVCGKEQDSYSDAHQANFALVSEYDRIKTQLDMYARLNKQLTSHNSQLVRENGQLSALNQQLASRPPLCSPRVLLATDQPVSNVTSAASTPTPDEEGWMMDISGYQLPRVHSEKELSKHGQRSSQGSTVLMVSPAPSASS